MRRPEMRQEAPAEVARDLAKEGVLAERPLIVEHLCNPTYEDGTDRELSTLTVSFMEGGIRLALNDQDNRRGLYTQGDCIEEALELLEQCLHDNTGRWYVWGKRKGKK